MRVVSDVASFAARVTALGLVLSATGGHAHARPSRFDLLCHYARASGHESYRGTQVPYTGPRIRTLHLAVDLVSKTQRELNHGLVPGPYPIASVNSAEIRVDDTPYMKTIIRWSDGKYTETDVQEDKSLLIYRGRCKFRAFTPPGPPGQAYRGW
jgi:hypothetical protein